MTTAHRYPLPRALAALGALFAVLLAAPVTAQNPVRFALFGDYYSASVNTGRVAGLVTSWAPDFIVTTGDNTNSGTVAGLDAQVGAYYHSFIKYPAGSTSAWAAQGSATQRFFPSLGNHDVDAGLAGWSAYFELPGNERYYEFVQGPVHFFVLNSDSREVDGIISTSTQADWLQGALAASAAPWKVVIMHRPAFSSGANHGSAPELQWPYKEWGASIVLAGHDHCYERLDIDGLPFVTVGTGGQPLYSFRNPPVTGSLVRYSSDHGALLVEASADSFKCRFYAVGAGAPGTLIDAFALGVSAPPGWTAAEPFERLAAGTRIGSDAEWFDGGAGPTVGATSGVAGGHGLGNSANIFIWKAHPFTWTDPPLQSVVFELDFQAGSGGSTPFFDDDRIGWMTTDTDVNSDNFFGVQLDPVTDPNTGLQLEAYWRNEAAERIAVPMADLTGIVAGAWYRLRLEVGKLDAASASLAVTLTALEESGEPGAVVASGAIASTALLPEAERPAARYFSTVPAFPAFKNHSNVTGACDNAGAQLVASAPSGLRVTVSVVGSGTVTKDPDEVYYEEGSFVQLTATPAAGWLFKGWSGDLAGLVNPVTVTVDRDLSITARFEPGPNLGLIGWWAFEDGGGGVALDGSGLGHHAEVLGPTWTDGQDGGALDFDGAGSHVLVPDAPALDLGTNRFTVALWMNGDALTNDWITLLQRTNSAGSWFDWQFYARAADAPTANRPVFRIDWDGDGAIDSGEQVQGDVVLAAGRWYHLAVTYDGSALRLYIDGTLRGTTTRSGGTVPPGTRGIWMGANEAWGEPLAGRLDEVRLYERALSAIEIAGLMLPGGQGYQIQAAIEGEGAVLRTPDQPLYELGTLVGLEAVAAPGWRFAGWSGDLGGEANPQDLTVTRDMSVTAHFVSIQASLVDTLVSHGALWRYRDDGSDQGTAWREAGFADGTWAQGRAQLGYGDGDEVTVVSYGPDANLRHVTTYFRRTFAVPEPGVFGTLRLDLLRDDGAIVYLNGIEVMRSHMPSGEVLYSTLASSPAVGGTDEGLWYSAPIDPSLLVAGDNVLAVEIHQQARNSSDISFDLRLVGTVTRVEEHVETFDAMPAPAPLAAQPGWRDAGDGPGVATGIGVGGSQGLTPATDVFTWAGQSFDWLSSDLWKALFEMDFQSSAGGSAALFDDDRVGWTVARVTASSDSVLGVQLDPRAGGTTPCIETYWRNAAGTRVESTLVDLTGRISPSTWYRLRLEVEKLDVADARLGVTLMRLDAAGVPVEVVGAGELPSTAAWGTSGPAARYFAPGPMQPAFKNFDAVAGAADRAVFRLVTGDAPLMELASLGAAVSGGRVQVSWTTAAETHALGFEVERAAAAGGPWHVLPQSFVAGHGTTRVPHDYTFEDEAPAAGERWYRLRAMSTLGDEMFSAAVEVSGTVDAPWPGGALAFALDPVRPNPVHGRAVIRFTLPRASEVTLAVYDAAGRQVARLATGARAAGQHVVAWQPRGLASGIYWCRLEAAGQRATRRLALVR